MLIFHSTLITFEFPQYPFSIFFPIVLSRLVMSNSPKNASNHARTTRSNSQTNFTLSDMKELLERSKNETIAEMKLQTDRIADTVMQILSRLEDLEASNVRLQKKNQELELELEHLKSECRDGYAAVADEVYQRSRRERNLIISGVPESNIGTIGEREQADESFCRRLFADLSTSVDFEKATRIGRSRNGRSRLLRVRFQKTEDKFRILRTCKELRKHEEYKNVFINLDRTPLEQRIDKRLRDELIKRREGGETDLVIYKGKVVKRNEIKNFPPRF